MHIKYRYDNINCNGTQQFIDIIIFIIGLFNAEQKRQQCVIFK